MRPESWASWATGTVFGGVAGLTVAVLGAPALVLCLALLTIAFVAARSPMFLSGALTGVGGIWLALLVRAKLACEAFDAGAKQGCQAFGMEPFAVVSAIVLWVGLLLGAVAWRRRTAQRRRANSADPSLSR